MTHSTDVDTVAENRVVSALARVPADRYPALADLLERFATAGERMADPPADSCPRCWSVLTTAWVADQVRWWHRLLRRYPPTKRRLRCEPCGREISPPIGPVKP